MPAGRLPLRIFEPRYLTMVKACLKSDSGFGICLSKDGAETGPSVGTYPYGTLIKIVDWDMDDSGLLLIVTEGVQKFRTISATESETGLLLGEIELLPAEEKSLIPAELQSLAELLQRALDNMGPLLDYAEADFTDALWVGSRLVELLPMPPAMRHDMIAISDPVERLRVLQGFINDEENWQG